MRSNEEERENQPLHRLGGADVASPRAFVVTRRAVLKVTILATVGFLIICAWLTSLHFQFFQGDIARYWVDSLAWRTPFNPDHVPGYPLLLAALRFLTGNHFKPIFLFFTVSLCAHIAGSLGVYVGVASHAGERIGYLSVLLFILWPFVGTTYVSFPMSDGLALGLLAWAVALFLMKRFRRAALLLGLAAVVHKGTWIFVILLTLAAILRNRRSFPFAAVLITGCPLALLWLSGMVWNHYGPMWLLSVSLPIQFATKSRLPVLDGLVGTLLRGGLNNLVKDLILWTHVGLLIALLIALARGRRKASHWYGLAIVAGLLFLYCSLNQNIVWAAVRYSKIAALPVGFWLGGQPRVAAFLSRHSLITVDLVLALLASQFVYAWYMVEIFFARG